VFQGICNVKSNNLPDAPTFVRLWVHEMDRVFKDRLVENKDTDDFTTLVFKSVTSRLKMTNDEIFSKDHILFADFIEKELENRS